MRPAWTSSSPTSTTTRASTSTGSTTTQICRAPRRDPGRGQGLVRSRPRVIAALMVERGEADALLCGWSAATTRSSATCAACSALDPGVQGAAAMTGGAQRPGRVVLHRHPRAGRSRPPSRSPRARCRRPTGSSCSASSRRSRCCRTPTSAATTTPGAQDARGAARDPRARAAGSWRSTARCMADTALGRGLRHRICPQHALKGRANLFVMPNLDAANIAYNMVRARDDRRRGARADPDGRLASRRTCLTPASTPRRVVNMTAIAAVEAQIRADAARGRGREVRVHQPGQFLHQVVVHPVMAGPGVDRGVEVEAGAHAQVVAVGVGDARHRAGWCRVRPGSSRARPHTAARRPW
jgi:hypothetical protein